MEKAEVISPRICMCWLSDGERLCEDPDQCGLPAEEPVVTEGDEP